MKTIIFIFLFVIVSTSLLDAQDTIKIRSGWNNIGAISTQVLSEIRSEPLGIITSYYFGYTPTGYTATDTLNKGSGYWVKANQAGLLIMGTYSVNACPPTVLYGGRGYNTIQVGTQCWFLQNLDIGTMVNGSQNQGNNNTIEKYCYDNNPANCSIYGGLYQWGEAMQYDTTAGAQGICPAGWHIPTHSELQTLAPTVNNDGNALKAVGQGAGDGAGTNTSGFSSLFSGSRNTSSNFYNIGYTIDYWSSTESSPTYAHYLSLYNNGSNIFFYDDNPNVKEYGFSVRCLIGLDY